MASNKSKIKFNKLRNTGDKIKAKFKRDKDKEKEVKSKKSKTVKPKKDKVKKDKKPRNKRKTFYIVLSVITGLAILAIVAVIAFAAYIVINAPEFSEDKLFNKDSTIIYAKDGSVLATLGMNVGGDDVEKRIKLDYEDLPQVLVDAVIATEDSRFFQHNGVDLARFLKASIGQVLGNSDAGGASTLTMQVSKNALTDTTSEGIQGIIRKFTDVYLSIFKIEKQYTKQDIFELYINSEFLGNEAYGVEQASKTYFGKSAKYLSLSEAAMIAGLFQAPGAYDPFVFPEKAEARRNQVLNLMLRHGYISKKEMEIAKSISVKDMLVKSNTTVSPYLGYINTVLEEVMEKYNVNPYKVPMDIYTMFDRSKQDVINNIYNGSYGYEFRDHLVQLGVAIVDNSNGAIVAIGAGRNRDKELGYNYATMINRHPGSIIKPILDYGPAIEYLNWSTYSPIFDEPTYYSSGEKINNWHYGNDGLVSLRTALSESMNTCALRTFRSTTNDQKWQFATSLGITPGNSDGKIFESASIGAFEGVNPAQMASAFSAFANGGYYTKGYTVSKIVYKESGDEVENSYTRERVMKETTAFIITDILFDVTPSIAYVYGNQIATKTGTSSYETSALREKGIWESNVVQDAWVVTYNPDFTIAFWYGYDELYSDYYHTMNTTTTQRAIIQSYLTKNILNTGSRFTRPKGITTATVEFGTIPAELASPYTPSDLVQTHYFISGTEPTKVSDRFSQLDNPTKVKVQENGNSATITWNSIKIPNAIDEDYLNSYYSKNYAEFAYDYLARRLEYNRLWIGTVEYEIYLKSGSNLTLVGSTSENEFTIDDTSGYDSIVVKTAYNKFKDNRSSGVEINLTGNTSRFTVSLLPISTSDGEYINPTFTVGEDIPNMGLDTVRFLINDNDVTDTISSFDKQYVIKDCTGDTCRSVDKIDNSKTGTYKITYTINYMGAPYKESRTVIIKEKEANPTD